MRKYTPKRQNLGSSPAGVMPSGFAIPAWRDSRSRDSISPTPQRHTRHVERHGDLWQRHHVERPPHSLVFGFAAAMLGISGFESSANFIEEQKEGVFPKTLRNMWIAVAIFNPVISLLSLGLLRLAQIQEVPPDLLAQIGNVALGRRLALMVSADAILVLSGAVLTSFVGVTGLMRRMALDRCLPQVRLQENRWRGTNHWILYGFFGLCVWILAITAGRIEAWAGVYTLAFLSVMALFGFLSDSSDSSETSCWIPSISRSSRVISPRWPASWP